MNHAELIKISVQKVQTIRASEYELYELWKDVLAQAQNMSNKELNALVEQTRDFPDFIHIPLRETWKTTFG